jgi:hypothetical protein
MCMAPRMYLWAQQSAAVNVGGETQLLRLCLTRQKPEYNYIPYSNNV